MRYFFVEVLEIRTWRVSVWPSVRKVLQQQPGVAAKLFFMDGRPSVERFVRKFAKCYHLQIERLSFDAAEIFDEDETLIWIRLYYRDMLEALRNVILEPEFRDFLAAANDSAGLKAYIKKQALPGVNIFAGSGLWRAMYLFQVALWKARKDGVADDRTTLFLKRTPWIDAMRRYFYAYGKLNVVAVGHQSLPWDIWRRLLGRDVRLIGEKVRRFFTSIGRESRPVIRSPYLALQYYGHFNIDQPHSHSDFFFWQQCEPDRFFETGR